MERDVLTIGVSTYEALRACVERNVEVIYVWRGLYEEMEREVKRILRNYGYRLPGILTKNGVLVAKKGINLYQTGIVGAEWIF